MKRRKWKKIRIKNLKYKERYLLIVLFLTGLFFLSLHLILPTLGKYTSITDLALDVDYAIYLFKEETTSFNINLDGIIPRTDPYVTTFTIANYDEKKKSDVDIEYTLQIRSTTNLPLQYKLLRKREGESTFSTNLLASKEDKVDEDGSWYHHFRLADKMRLNYQVQAKDFYQLEILFPSSYKTNLEYADGIEHIEITIDSEQVIEEETV